MHKIALAMLLLGTLSTAQDAQYQQGVTTRGDAAMGFSLLVKPALGSVDHCMGVRAHSRSGSARLSPMPSSLCARASGARSTRTRRFSRTTARPRQGWRAG